MDWAMQPFVRQMDATLQEQFGLPPSNYTQEARELWRARVVSDEAHSGGAVFRHSPPVSRVFCEGVLRREYNVSVSYCEVPS
mmetsp:Transcript_4913/g.17828  ORF Transcript_4913/g.17828 Transcript_4913/m.17828 type:complete len:82 (+) Transcript_4913:134-379(+)